MTRPAGFDRMFTGKAIDAHYVPSDEPMFQHNCYIEALPPVLTAGRAADLMRREPSYHASERLLPPERRLIAVQRIANYIDPMWVFLDLEQRFSRVIRNGYLARNPLSAEWRKQMMAAFPKIDLGADMPGYVPQIRSTAAGFSILGVSGIGKSTAVESVLSLYPQLISHTGYNGIPFDQQQLTWLKLDCPFDGSVRGLCMMFFQVVDQILGTRFYQKYNNKRRSTDELLPLMKNTAAITGLGVLVIDEIQRLSSAASGGAEKMLNFFVELINTIGVPVVLIGTFKAYGLLASEFAQARRSAGQGDLIWPNLKYDDNWEFFIEGLWRYQWTNTPSELTNELSKVIYDESQGITDIAVKLYMLAQWSVIGEDNEELIPETFTRVAQESLQLAQPILEALRTNNQELLRKIPDIQSPLANLDAYYEKAAKRVQAEQGKSRGSLGSRKKDVLQQIVTQLSLAGFGSDRAWEVANQTLSDCGDSCDIKQLITMAFQSALAQQPTNDDKKKPRPVRKKPKTPPLSKNDMRTIVRQEADPHAALQQAGLTKPATEFLE